MTILQRWKKTSLPNKLLIETGTLVAIGTLFYAVAAIIQVCILRESSEQTARQTERIIVEARRLAKSADESLNQSKAAMEASSAQAKAALDASIQGFRLDQRAWLGVTRIDASLDPNKPTNLFIHIINSGKTPANKARSNHTVECGPIGMKPPLLDNEAKATARSTMVPGSERILTHLNICSTKERVRDVVSGQLDMYVYGTIWYEDIFGIPHETQFCSFYDPSIKALNGCSEHNRAK